MGLPIRVETRTGDTPSDRKARQRVRPPQILLTTPESLSLLLSYPDSFTLFENLKTIVVDELHGFAKEKRGDLLSLSMARLQKIAPDLRRVGLSRDDQRSGRLSQLACSGCRHGRGRSSSPAIPAPSRT